jgi:hypothetical protein
VFIPNGKHRLLECSALDFGQEIREFLVCGQLNAFLCSGVLATRRGGCVSPKTLLIRGILAKHRSEASYRCAGVANASILLFKGIFYLTVRAQTGNVSGFLHARNPLKAFQRARVKNHAIVGCRNRSALPAGRRH